MEIIDELDPASAAAAPGLSFAGDMDVAIAITPASSETAQRVQAAAGVVIRLGAQMGMETEHKARALILASRAGREGFWNGRRTAQAQRRDARRAASRPPETGTARQLRRAKAVVAERPVQGTLYTGVWRCEARHWRIAFGPAEHELFTVL